MMNISLSADQTLNIESPVVTLRSAQPVLNGIPLEDWTCEVLRSDREYIELRYTSQSLARGLFRRQAHQSILWLISVSKIMFFSTTGRANLRMDSKWQRLPSPYRVITVRSTSLTGIQCRIYRPGCHHSNLNSRRTVTRSLRNCILVSFCSTIHQRPSSLDKQIICHFENDSADFCILILFYSW